jgi:hypothetical protein
LAGLDIGFLWNMIQTKVVLLFFIRQFARKMIIDNKKVALKFLAFTVIFKYNFRCRICEKKVVASFKFRKRIKGSLIKEIVYYSRQDPSIKQYKCLF